MAEYVELTPDGLFAYKWDRKKRKTVRFRPKKLSIATQLRTRCEIAEGTTLRNIFDTVDKYKLLKLIVSQYSWCPQIDEFHAQAKEPMRDDPDDKDTLTYLEIYHHPEVHQYTEKKKHPGGIRERIKVVDFDTSVGFHGIGPSREENGPANRDDGNTNYSVSYSPMWKMADLPVKLNKEFTVYEPFDSSKHKRGNPPQELLKATRDFSLLEVLDAIYWDISFIGGPAENAEFIEGLKDQVEEIKSGNVAMIPMEQVFPDMKKDDEPPPNPDDPPKMKVLMHPDVARFFGVDPNSIPLDDKEIIRPDENENQDD